MAWAETMAEAEAHYKHPASCLHWQPASIQGIFGAITTLKKLTRKNPMPQGGAAAAAERCPYGVTWRQSPIKCYNNSKSSDQCQFW